MLVKEISPYESFPTVIALVRLHIGVGEAMLLLVILVLEDPVTEVAWEGGTYSVVGRLHVGVQAALPLEASLAELTLDCVDSAVATHVDP